MRQQLFLILSAWAVIGACSAVSVNRKPISNEERTFRANCRACHHLPDPQSHTDEQWEELVKRHAQENFSLSAEKSREIIRFLQQAND